MTTFSSDFVGAGFPDLLAQFGESVTYTSVAGVNTACTAIVHREASERKEYNDGLGDVDTATIEIAAAVITNPEINARITCGAEVFSVDRPPMINDGVITFHAQVFSKATQGAPLRRTI